jgi:hypothetical protein
MSNVEITYRVKAAPLGAGERAIVKESPDTTDPRKQYEAPRVRVSGDNYTINLSDVVVRSASTGEDTCEVTITGTTTSDVGFDHADNLTELAETYSGMFSDSDAMKKREIIHVEAANIYQGAFQPLSEPRWT